MIKINWPPEKNRMIKYEFNSLDKDYIEIKAEDGSRRPNTNKVKDDNTK